MVQRFKKESNVYLGKTIPKPKSIFGLIAKLSSSLKHRFESQEHVK